MKNIETCWNYNGKILVCLLVLAIKLFTNTWILMLLKTLRINIAVYMIVLQHRIK